LAEVKVYASNNPTHATPDAKQSTLFLLGTLSASKADTHILRVMFTALPMSMSAMMNGAMVSCMTWLSSVAAW
jgi:hypothetical protein